MRTVIRPASSRFFTSITMNSITIVSCVATYFLTAVWTVDAIGFAVAAVLSRVSSASVSVHAVYNASQAVVAFILRGRAAAC